jgi:hypothetical protein
MVSEFPLKLHQRYSSLPILGSVLDEFAAYGPACEDTRCPW